METGFITPNKEILIMPYYEMGDYAEYVVNQFVKEFNENMIIFDNFKKNYTYFDPYFDFLVFILNYEVINPLLIENSVGYKNKEHMFIQKVDNYNNYEKKDPDKIDYLRDIIIPKSDDITLGLKLFDSENSKDSCVLMLDGYSLTVDRNIIMYHEEIFKLIINNFILKNKEICENYVTKMQEDIALEGCFYYRYYVVNNLGYVYILYCPVYSNENKGSYIAVYAKNGVNSYIQDIIDNLASNYPGSLTEGYELNQKELKAKEKINRYLFADYFNRMKGSKKTI